MVDNDRAARESLRAQLQANGYEVNLVSDGFTALMQARTFRPNLIIQELTLPRMDGYMLCQLIKINDVYKNIPVLVLSAGLTEEAIQRLQNQGANAWMTKPYAAEQLLKKIEELVAGPA